MTPLLRTITANQLPRATREPVDAEAMATAGDIVRAVREGGEPALREHAERFGELTPEAALLAGPEEMAAARHQLEPSVIQLLERTAARIREFAERQRQSLHSLVTAIPGGRAGHRIEPLEVAGCYAPGGRFPLPSSVLMTVVTARAAGVRTVWVASPKPTSITLAAAALGGADGLLCAGGAHAITALAYGVGGVPACNIVVGPGNRWVTAAKYLVSHRVRIDLLAGPSELIILADDSADPAWIAADLIAQAEHDIAALPLLVTPSEQLIDAVNVELTVQLDGLSTADIARQALARAFAVRVDDLAEGASVCDTLAPEHLQLSVRDPERVARHVHHFGGLFIGEQAAEVLGDYGAGPNHTLPTGGSARWTGGLSVFSFLRISTWMQVDRGSALTSLARDAAALARLEGLEGHARAAERRLAHSDV